MIYRRKTYRVLPEQVAPFTAFYAEYLLPNQLKHGARLVGRYVSESRDEIVAIWEYDSRQAYERVQAAVAGDPMHIAAQARRAQLPPLFQQSSEDFLEPTVTPHRDPRHIVSVAGYITNERGEALLVRTHWRGDTWELPGGQVEEGEDLVAALVREVREESGVQVEVSGGVTGVYVNTQRGIVNTVMRGRAISGALTTSHETQEIGWFALTPERAAELVTRPHFLVRVLDALRGQAVPYEAFEPRPYRLVTRIEP